MPPHRKDADASGRGSGGRTRREGNALVNERSLSTGLQHDLDTILQQRETLERRLAAVDERVYDLESEYLKECVELGGSLFDGYGVERSSLLHTGTTFSFASPTVVSPSGRGSAAAGYTNFPGSPSASSGAISAFTAAMHSSAGNGTATEASAMAFRARTQNFTPAERIFSSVSVGAIGRVEQAKAIAAAGGGSSATQRATATAGGTSSRRAAPGGGVWGVNSAGGGGVMTRRRRRGESEKDDEDDDEGKGSGRRRARGE